jgi:hypothetical protein
MAVATTISRSDVARARRLDAQFFNPVFLRLEAVLASVTTDSLSSLCWVSDGNHGSISEHFSTAPLRIPGHADHRSGLMVIGIPG